ncbi:MAG: c-type cytochrome [Gammaproteobacteria bacterium]|nr:MAG: c-type cytochrome [Gammaproteobacteria bacterium]
MKNLLVLFMAVVGMMFVSLAHAAAGDAEKGKQKAAACAACHGADGNGMAGAPLYPKLADQVPGYILHELKAFKKGKGKDGRPNPIMEGMVAALSEEDMADLDAYYSSLKIKITGISKSNEALALEGEKIYRGGYRKYNIPACMSCHGPKGAGIPVQYPRLAGLSAEYTEKQLREFKDGTRKHNMMNPIAFLLSNEQIKQLSLYTQGLK